MQWSWHWRINHGRWGIRQHCDIYLLTLERTQSLYLSIPTSRSKFSKAHKNLQKSAQVLVSFPVSRLGENSAHQYHSCRSFITPAGPWEVIKKLHLEEELLKATDLKPTEGPGNLQDMLNEAPC